jgi:hypothetical protein
MACYSYDLQQLPTSLLAAAILQVALKQGIISSKKYEVDELMKIVADFADLSNTEINEKASLLLKFAKNFDSQFPNLRNLKIVYGDELKSLRLTGHTVMRENGPS